jgi:hypothetical protein
MHLAGRCTAATLALAAGAAIALLTLNGWRMPFAADGRGAVAALGIAGAAVYALCPAGRRPDALTSAVGVLGVGAAFVLLAGVAIGTRVLLTLELVLLTTLWAVLLYRHLREPRPRADEPAEAES